jgi:hypothetical protein
MGFRPFLAICSASTASLVSWSFTISEVRHAAQKLL